jgi:type IV pilus assembly protein PilC
LPTGRRQRELADVCEILNRGDATAAAAAFTRLPEHWIPLIGSTSATSTNDVLERFFAESHQADETRRRWGAVLAYPLFLLLFAALVMVGLAIFVIPTFRAIFDDFGLQLPQLTIWTLSVAAWIASGRIVFALLAVVTVVGVITWYCGRAIADRFVAFCDRSTTISRFARFTADLLQGGLALPDAVRIAGRASRSSALSLASQRVALEISRGELHHMPRVPKPLTLTLLSALDSDFSPSARIALLETLADCYSDQAQSRFSWTHATVGPLTIFGVAFVVGFVVLTLFLPLFSLINALSG